MIFVPKVIFFPNKQGGQSSIQTLVQERIDGLTIRNYVKFVPLDEVAGEEEHQIADQASLMKGAGEVKLPGEDGKSALSLVNILVLGGELGAEGIQEASETIVRLTRFRDPKRPNLNIMLAGQSQSTGWNEIIVERQWERGLGMTSEEYPVYVADVLTALILTPSQDDILRYFLTGQSIWLGVQRLRTPKDDYRKQLTRWIRSEIVREIREGEVPAEFHEGYSRLVQAIEEGRDARRELKDAPRVGGDLGCIPKVRIPLFANRQHRLTYMESQIKSFHESRDALGEGLLVWEGEMRVKTWNDGLGSILERETEAWLLQGWKRYRLGKLRDVVKKKLEEIRPRLEEPSAWQFIRPLPGVKVSGLPFTGVWIAGLFVAVAALGGVFLPLSLAVQVLGVGLPILYIAAALGTARIYLRFKERALEKGMAYNLGAFDDFVKLNAQNFDAARANYLRRIFIRIVDRHGRRLHTLLGRISKREDEESEEEKRSREQFEGELSETERIKIMECIREGAPLALDLALDRTPGWDLVANSASDRMLSTAIAEFKNLGAYKDIVKLFFERDLEDVLNRVENPGRLPCGDAIIQQNRRSVIVLAPPAAYERLGREHKSGLVETPSSDTLFIVQFAPL